MVSLRVLQRQELEFGRGAGSRKYLLEAEGVAVECAFLFHEESRGLCCSAQAGCAFGCRHCATTYAPQPFLRNLSEAEIVEIARFVAEDANGGTQLDFLDFSGVGDCCANWDAVRAACREALESGLTDVCRVTSIAPRAWCLRIERGGPGFPLDRVVISLHGADIETRRLLIPNAEDPWKAARWWRSLNANGTAVDLNYAVHQENSGPEHLGRLVEFLHAQAGWVREIRLSTINAVTGIPFRTPPTFDDFAVALQERLPAGMRMNRFLSLGAEAGFACGQMRARTQS